MLLTLNAVLYLRVLWCQVSTRIVKYRHFVWCCLYQVCSSKFESRTSFSVCHGHVCVFMKSVCVCVCCLGLYRPSVLFFAVAWVPDVCMCVVGLNAVCRG